MHITRSLHIFKTISHMLAGLVLVLGLMAGISLMASASNVHNVLLPLQVLGAEAVANLVTPFLASLMSGLGVFALIVSLVLSCLLFAAGLLLGRIASLEARLAGLEAHIEPSR